MKKLLKVIPLILVVLLLTTGCGMKAEYGINIGKDKKVKLEFLVAQDDEFIDAMLGMGSEDDSSEEKTYTDAERWEYLESSKTESEDYKDFKAEKYDKDGYKGYIYSLDLGSIDELVADSKDAIDIESVGKDSKLFVKEGNVYKLQVKTSEEDNSQVKEYADYVDFDLKLKVTLPNKAKANNATTVEGNTYIWDLTKADSINLEFELGKTNTALIIGIAVAAVVVICGAVVVISKKKKSA